MNAMIITTSNLIFPVEWPTDFSFSWVEKLIGCDMIEIVRPEKLPRKFVMLIDEEGKLKPNSINPICSWLYGTEHHGDPIVGNAMIVKETFVNGEMDFCGMTVEELEELRTTLVNGGDG